MLSVNTPDRAHTQGETYFSNQRFHQVQEPINQKLIQKPIFYQLKDQDQGIDRKQSMAQCQLGYPDQSIQKKRSLSTSINQGQFKNGYSPSMQSTSLNSDPFMQINSEKNYLELQQVKKDTHPKKPSIILYRSFTKADPDEYSKHNMSYYEPAQYKNIKNIMQRDDKEQQIKTPLKVSTNTEKEKRVFINPKSTESTYKKSCSRIQKQFINTYKEKFIIDGKQTINEHPNAVNSILYSGLCASAIASHKWQSVSAKRRITETTPQCPEFSTYPLTPRAIQAIEHIQKKMNIKPNGRIKYYKKEMIQKDQLQKQQILKNSSDLKSYLTTLENLTTKFHNIFGTNLDDYNDILDYCDVTKEDFNNFDIKQAEFDVDFIKKSKKTFGQNPGDWILSKQQQLQLRQKRQLAQQKTAKSQTKRWKPHYEDVDDVFQEKPHIIEQSGIILTPYLENSKAIVKTQQSDQSKQRK